jgi:hypothetical protein
METKIQPTEAGKTTKENMQRLVNNIFAAQEGRQLLRQDLLHNLQRKARAGIGKTDAHDPAEHPEDTAAVRQRDRPPGDGPNSGHRKQH